MFFHGGCSGNLEMCFPFAPTPNVSHHAARMPMLPRYNAPWLFVQWSWSYTDSVKTDLINSQKTNWAWNPALPPNRLRGNTKLRRNSRYHGLAYKCYCSLYPTLARSPHSPINSDLTLLYLPPILSFRLSRLSTLFAFVNVSCCGGQMRWRSNEADHSFLLAPLIFGDIFPYSWPSL